AAVPAITDAVHLEPDPHVAVVGGIDRDAGRARDTDVRAIVGDLDGEPRPALGPVGRAEDARRARRAGAREHDGGVGRIDGHAPDHRALHRVVEQPPLPAAVVAPVETEIGPGIDDLGAARVRAQHADDAIGVHALAHARARPALAVVGAHHDALTDRPDQDVSFARHGLPPRAYRSERCRLTPPRLYTAGHGAARGGDL